MNHHDTALFESLNHNVTTLFEFFSTSFPNTSQLRLQNDLNERDSLLDEMQKMLHEKSIETDELIAEAVAVANEVGWLHSPILSIIEGILLNQTKVCLVEQIEEKDKQLALLQQMLDDAIARGPSSQPQKVEQSL